MDLRVAQNKSGRGEKLATRSIGYGLTVLLAFLLVFSVYFMQAPSGHPWGLDTHRFVDSGAIELLLSVDPEVETIIILHTNDIHGHLLPEDGRGGSAYIASIVDEEREQHPGRVLLLDAGDIVDGDPVGDLFYGRSVIEVMNAMGYDAMTVGNHELGRYGGDYTHGVISIENDYLLDLKGIAEFPMLAANVLINGSKPFESCVVKEVGGVKIGIIGVTTYFQPPENVQILDSDSAARECVEEIENETDLIIALTHLGLESDINLASNVEGIDIIIGGHSHTVRWEPENVGETKIVQAGSYGKYVGKIRLEFDAENYENYNFSYELIEVKHPPLEENQGIAEMVENYDNIISPIVDVKIGYTEDALSRSELGEMAAESFRENTGADVGFQNWGGIRNYVPAGDITIRQIHKALPYGNELMAMDLKGSSLKYEFNYYGYAGGAYQRDSEWYLTSSGEKIEDDEYYRVATNSYTGTRYVFVQGRNVTYHGICRDAFINYTMQTHPYLRFEISPSEQAGKAGETLIYDVKVTNLSIPDNYMLTVNGDSGWGLSLSDNLLEDVQPGENVQVTLSVAIPSGAIEDESAEITITATSQADNTVSASGTCTAAVGAEPEFPVTTVAISVVIAIIACLAVYRIYVAR